MALANAARETLRMADMVEEMLKGSRELLRRDDAGSSRSCAGWTTGWIGSTER